MHHVHSSSHWVRRWGEEGLSTWEQGVFQTWLLLLMPFVWWNCVNQIALSVCCAGWHARFFFLFNAGPISNVRWISPKTVIEHLHHVRLYNFYYCLFWTVGYYNIQLCTVFEYFFGAAWRARCDSQPLFSATWTNFKYKIVRYVYYGGSDCIQVQYSNGVTLQSTVANNNGSIRL